MCKVSEIVYTWFYSLYIWLPKLEKYNNSSGYVLCHAQRLQKWQVIEGMDRLAFAWLTFLNGVTRFVILSFSSVQRGGKCDWPHQVEGYNKNDYYTLVQYRTQYYCCAAM